MKADEVAHYLLNNPQFFEQHAELVANMVVPHPHGGRTISITERQMFALRDKNRKLENKMGELLQFGEENDEIGKKMHRLAVSLIAATHVHSVLHSLYLHLREDFEIPHVALRLWRKPPGIDELPEFAAVDPSLETFGETLSQPYCGSTSGFETSPWFGDVAPHIRSQALLDLRESTTSIGMLALGSEDPERFYAHMGTLYLERLGDMAAAALSRALRR